MAEALHLKRLGSIGLALAIGAAGGGLFLWLNFPLPWMLGPIVFNLIASMARLPIGSPARVRPFVSIVIGVMLGSSFSPEMMGRAMDWIPSLAMLAVYLAISAMLVVPFYRHLGGFDPVTAYFAGMPGGLAEMTFVGRDMGGDDRAIVLAHASRIVVVVVAVAIFARFSEAYDAGARQGAGVPWSAVSARDLALLAGGGFLGLFLGRALRLPAPQLIGPMLVSAALHLSELVTVPPPRELIVVAQIFLGTIVGCRFVGTSPTKIGRSILLGIGATMIMLSVTVFFALALHELVGQETIQILLAYSPGGLAEMSLMAIAMDADIAFVAVHHLARITLVLLAAPLIFSIMRKRRDD